MNIQNPYILEINYLFDRLQEGGFSKYRLLERIKGLSQKDTILMLQNYIRKYKGLVWKTLY